MKKNFSNKVLWVAVLGILFNSCKEKQVEQSPNHSMDSHSSMHHDEVLDSAVARLTKPISKYVATNIKTVSPSWGVQVFAVDIPGRMTYDARNSTGISARISGRIEKLHIKYNYQPVQKGDPIMAIYSPELVSTQREVLLLKRSQSDQRMLSKAIQKLRYLGMSQQQINDVISKGDVQYRVTYYSPVSGYIMEQTANSPVQASLPVSSDLSEGMGDMSGSGSMSESALANNLAIPDRKNTSLSIREGQYLSTGKRLFTIYTNDNLLAEFSVNSQIASHLKVGQQILIDGKNQYDALILGEIGLIQPVYNEGQNFASIRVYLKNEDKKIGELLVGTLAIRSEESYWLPKDAVILLGNHAVLFRRMHHNFQSVPIDIGMRVNGMIEIKTDIEGWDIASNAAYLVDSESFISLNN